MTVELGTYRLRGGLFCSFQSRAKGCGYLTHLGVGTGSSEPDGTGSLIWRVPELFTFQTNNVLNDSNLHQMVHVAGHSVKMSMMAVCGRCREVDSYVLYPWVHQWTNNVCREDQVRPVPFPDVDTSALPDNANFSMAAGDFLEVYHDPGN